MKNIKISMFKTAIIVLLSVYVLIQYQSRNNGRYTIEKSLMVFDSQTGIIYSPQGTVLDLIEESKMREDKKDIKED